MTSFLEKHVRLGLLAYAVPPSEFAFAGNFTESPTFAELKGKRRLLELRLLTCSPTSCNPPFC